jgi:hypothetical protein
MQFEKGYDSELVGIFEEDVVISFCLFRFSQSIVGTERTAKELRTSCLWPVIKPQYLRIS